MSGDFPPSTGNMKPAHRRQQGRPALDLIEAAVHLLRTAPATALATYYVGSLPFVLGGLYFWADMSRSPFARQRVVEAALGVSLLFVWLKFWQALFARRLRAHLTGEKLPSAGGARYLHILLTQATLQPTGLFLMPLAALPVLPFAIVYAFYQNLTALADTDAPGVGTLFRQAARHAGMWPRQNVLGLLYLAAFGLFVFLNCAMVGATLPLLLKSLLGIETVFSRSGAALLNTTFFAAMAGIAYLCLDPLLKAVYVLRCFHGEAVASGADLRAELRRRATPGARLMASCLLALTLAGATPLHAADTPPGHSSVPTIISPAELDHAIDEVMGQRKYTWRLPREKVTDAEAGEAGLFAKFFQRIGQLIRDALGSFVDWIGKLLQKTIGRRTASPPSLDWAQLPQVLLSGLLALVLATVAILLHRLWRSRRRSPQLVATEAIQPVPDITDENVGADALPEDGWTKLARELAARGEFRLALRAFYLASLAHLAQRNLISLARFKSNHDYELELSRRAHTLPALRRVFGENVGAFDRVWYGTHEATGELVTLFAANVDGLKTGG